MHALSNVTFGSLLFTVDLAIGRRSRYPRSRLDVICLSCQELKGAADPRVCWEAPVTIAALVDAYALVDDRNHPSARGVDVGAVCAMR